MSKLLKYRTVKQPTILIGMEKDKEVQAVCLNFVEGINVDLDLILGSVIMRHRQITKCIFNSNNIISTRKAALSLEIDELYTLDVENRICCDTKNLNGALSSDTLLFYLSKDSVWKVLGHYDVLALDEALPVLDVYKRYYSLYYPQAVAEFAFKDPKQPLRVYQVEERDGFEDFFCEPLFIESDIVEHVYVPLPKSSEVA